MHAIVLAGGYGTRLASFAGERPKVLAPVLGVPFADYLLHHLKKQGIRHVVMCVGYMGNEVEKYLGDGKRFGVSLAYSYDEGTGSRAICGTAHAVRKACRSIRQPFFVVNGDTLVPEPWAPMLERYRNSDALAMIAVYKNANNIWPSNVELASGKVERYSKTIRTRQTIYIDAGVGLFRAEAFERFPELAQMPELFGALSNSRLLGGFEMTSRFYEINTPSSLFEMENYLSAKSFHTPASKRL